MTGERGEGTLGRRMLAAFVLVAVSSVVALALAALVGTDRGLTAARESDRVSAAGRAAEVAVAAYRSAGGWAGVDFRPAQAVAAGAGARLAVLDERGHMVLSPSGMTPPSPVMRGPRAGAGAGVGAEHGITTAAVRVDGSTVGWVQLRFGAPLTSGARDVAWGWIAGAAVGALGLAIVMSLLVTRLLTRPIAGVTRAARAFAAGDRTARTGVIAVGELGELARAFDDMAEQVTRAEGARRRLAADVAHELRTPLASLQAGLEELRDGLGEPSAERLGALHDQALRLGRVVGDLAELSSAESAALSLRLEEIDLGVLVAAVLTAAEPRLRAAGLTVRGKLGEGVVVVGDPDRLHQAIGNLLDNAARYCRPGDGVTVAVRADGDQAVAEVSDTGPGIPADELPHVFDRLWRGRSSTGVAGSGIGLAVVRELVTAHQGTVTATSAPGGGTIFTVRLPGRAHRPVGQG